MWSCKNDVGHDVRFRGTWLTLTTTVQITQKVSGVVLGFFWKFHSYDVVLNIPMLDYVSEYFRHFSEFLVSLLSQDIATRLDIQVKEQ